MQSERLQWEQENKTLLLNILASSYCEKRTKILNKYAPVDYDDTNKVYQLQQHLSRSRQMYNKKKNLLNNVQTNDEVNQVSYVQETEC